MLQFVNPSRAGAICASKRKPKSVALRDLLGPGPRSGDCTGPQDARNKTTYEMPTGLPSGSVSGIWGPGSGGSRGLGNPEGPGARLRDAQHRPYPRQEPDQAFVPLPRHCLREDWLPLLHRPWGLQKTGIPSDPRAVAHATRGPETDEGRSTEDHGRRGQPALDTRILKTAPGFGPVRSAELLSIVINPRRFRTSRQFWCYCGLAIVQRSSSDYVQKPNGQWIWRRHLRAELNRNFNRMAKAIFKGAAVTVITSMPTEPLRQTTIGS